MPGCASSTSKIRGRRKKSAGLCRRRRSNATARLPTTRSSARPKTCLSTRVATFISPTSSGAFLFCATRVPVDQRRRRNEGIGAHARRCRKVAAGVYECGSARQIVLKGKQCSKNYLDDSGTYRVIILCLRWTRCPTSKKSSTRLETLRWEWSLRSKKGET